MKKTNKYCFRFCESSPFLICNSILNYTSIYQLFYFIALFIVYCDVNKDSKYIPAKNIYFISPQ